MWTTNKPVFSDDGQLKEITHDFGQDVTVVTNFERNTTQVIYGSIIDNEYPIIRDIEPYTQNLYFIAQQLKDKKG